MNAISPMGGSMPPKPSPAPITEAAPVKAVTPAQADDATSNQAEMKKEQAQAAREEAQAALEKVLNDEELSQETLDEIARDLETLHSVSLNFSRHEESGRTMVKVLNKETDEVIREIPSEKVLDIATKIGEMVGILFDEKV